MWRQMREDRGRLRIVFFGATELGHRCCRALLEMGEELVGIITCPESFRISYSGQPVRNVTFRSFDDLAADAGVPLIEMTGGSRQQYLDALSDLRPDFGLVVGWYYMVPAAVRARFPAGVAGIHASLLPCYRGGAPLVWAMINGESRSGVTLFHLEDATDAGDILGQRAFDIGSDDTIADVYARATDASVELVRQAIPLVREGRAQRVRQDLTDHPVFPQRSPRDGAVNWPEMSARQVHDWVRAQTRPYPGAFTSIKGRPMKIWRARIVAPPGTFRADPSCSGTIVTGPWEGDAPSVRCADGGVVQILELGGEDPAAETGPAEVHALRLEPGERLGA
jgi:methionyl-tRNA formyltransferase